MPLRFGVGLPTCMEGMIYPVPFGTAEDCARIAQLAERLGFDSVWGNDHMTTQQYVQREFPAPPSYYDLLVTLTHVGAMTTRIRLATGILVLPFRHVVVAAKQVATLDRLSHGRVILGVGTGAYREEYEALFPDARGTHRGTLVEEGMQALRLLFTERRATFRGQFVHFEDVESFPKPVQSPLPIYAGGNAPDVRRRAGHWADGWFPAVLSTEEVRRGAEDVRRAAEKANRDGTALEIAPQLVVSIGRTREEAQRRFRASQLHRHLESLRASTLRDQTGDYEQRSLIGSVEEVCERIRAYQAAGVTSLAGLLFVANTVPEMLESVELFGREVIPRFA